MIALTHCGRQRVDEKLSTSGPTVLYFITLFRIENIDIVFGGHSRTQMETWKLSETAIGLRSAPWCTHVTKVISLSTQSNSSSRQVSVSVRPEEPPNINWPPGIISVHSDTIPDPNIGKILQIQRYYLCLH